jgi:hypothetical protein
MIFEKISIKSILEYEVLITSGFVKFNSHGDSKIRVNDTVFLLEKLCVTFYICVFIIGYHHQIYMFQ